MTIAGDVILIVVGLVLCLSSRVVADNFRIPGNRTTLVKMGGMADDYVSRLYRWIVCVVTGLFLLGAGAVDLLYR